MATEWRLFQLAIVNKVADGLRGEDPMPVYLRKQRRTLADLIAGRPVKKWRLDRLQALCEELAKECLRLSSSPGCGTKEFFESFYGMTMSR